MSVTEADDQFKNCLDIAQTALSGQIEDRTMGATHYHTASIFPNWAKESLVTAKIGNHIFYAGIG